MAGSARRLGGLVAGGADAGDGVVGEVGAEPVVALDQPLEAAQ
jgi:hypothetical protein